MTRNLFIGADLTAAYQALGGAGGPEQIPATVAAIFNPGKPRGLVQQTDFAARAAALADEIAAARPDVVGLQEAAAWRLRREGEQAGVSDHLLMLEGELQSRGLAYRRAVVFDSGDVELPTLGGGTVGLTNRGAILAREGDFELSDAWSAEFDSGLPVRTPFGTFKLARGWGAVDVATEGQTVRILATHLEEAGSAARREVQLQQACELLDGPAGTELPVVMVGDFNARPGGATHDRLLTAGFEDAWTRAHPDGPAGETCCFGGSLDDPHDSLTSRIDLVLTRGALVARDAFLVGADPAAMRAGLWPSDHAGVVADLELRPGG